MAASSKAGSSRVRERWAGALERTRQSRFALDLQIVDPVPDVIDMLKNQPSEDVMRFLARARRAFNLAR